MFVFNRSALAVLAPIALLMAAVLWSSHATRAAAPATAVQAQGTSQGQVARVNQGRDGES
jgi:hypothetical protein